MNEPANEEKHDIIVFSFLIGVMLLLCAAACLDYYRYRQRHTAHDSSDYVRVDEDERIQVKIEK